ncbi:MAG TPA: hypothetical protein VJR05_06625 [Acidimicrobiia bacterium]|nr:hypothetical protein [Acidimicrobiia bacterium]
MKKATIVAAVGLVVGLLAIPGTAQPVTCPVVDTSVEEVVEGVTLEWTSSFLCSDVPTDPSSGEFHIEGSVANLSEATVNLSGLGLAFTTPPGSSGSVTSDDFAATIGPGSTHTFTATGTYQMVETDEGLKVNLHLRGAGDVDGEPFALGINVHVRGVGATEDGDGDDGDEGDDGGPPDFGDWTPGSGPPPFAGAPWVGAPGPIEATVTISEPDTVAPPEEEQEKIEDVEGPRWLRDDAEGWTPGTPSPPPWAGDDGDGGPPFMRDGSTGWKPGDGPPDWAPPGGGGDDDEPEGENGGA